MPGGHLQHVYIGFFLIRLSQNRMANRAQFLKRRLILTQDKAKFYVQGKVLLSKNMQLELELRDAVMIAQNVTLSNT